MFKYLLSFLLVCTCAMADPIEVSTPGSNIGIGTTSRKNALSVNNTLAIGSSEYTNTTVENNGLIVEGNVGVGTPNPSEKVYVNGNVKANYFLGDGSLLSNLPSGGGGGSADINWDSYEMLDSLSNDYKFLVDAAGTNKSVNWENTQQLLGVDSSVIYNVKRYGAKGDGIALYDGAVASSSTDFTSASAVFTSADVGKVITITGAAGSALDLTTTIAAYVSPTEVTLTDAASATVSSAMAIYGTDDTAAIRAAVAAVYDSGNGPMQGTVFFPEGVYMVNGAFDQTNHSQIALPTVALSAKPVSIEFRGASKPMLNTRHMGGSIIFGTRYGTDGSYSIISGQNSGQSGNLTFVRAHFQDIGIRTVQDPTHSALNLIDVDMASGDNVQISANAAPGANVPLQTHSDSYGLIMPGTLNGNVSEAWRALKVIRFYNGIQFGEHGQVDDGMVVYAINGLVFKDCRYPAKIGYVSVEITVNSVVMMGSVTNYLQIDVLDIEHESGTFANSTDLIDSSNLGVGRINYAIFNNGGGASFIRSGGKNVSLTNKNTNQEEFRSSSTENRFINTSTDSSTSGASLMLMQNDMTAVNVGTRLGTLGFAGSYSTTGTQFVYGASITADSAEGFTSSASGSNLRIKTAPIGSNTTIERVSIMNDGNVGIGTLYPNATLHVVGNAIITGLNSGECVQASTGGLLTTTGSACGSGGGGSGTVSSGTADRVAIYDTAGTTISSSSVITDNNTNIGIGTTGPREKLEINGNARATTFIGSLTGNADTVTTNANLTGTDVTSSGNAATLNSQWKGFTDGGTNVYTTTTTDNVGIGTTTPTSTFKLDVRGTTYLSGNVGIGTSSSLTSPLVVNGGVATVGTGDSYFNANGGNVGVGTSNPVGGLVIMNGNVGIGTWSPTGQFSLSNASAQAGQATCWTTAGRIGYCTSVVGAGGGCTCTGL